MSPVLPINTQRYQSGDYILEVTAHPSPLSQWSDRTVVRQLRFNLWTEHPDRQRLAAGNQQQLITLSNRVETYVQTHLTQQAWPQQHTIELLDTKIILSTLQLFDLAEVLHTYGQEQIILPTMAKPRRSRRWTGSAVASLLVAVGVTTAYLQYRPEAFQQTAKDAIPEIVSEDRFKSRAALENNATLDDNVTLEEDVAVTNIAPTSEAIPKPDAPVARDSAPVSNAPVNNAPVNNAPVNNAPVNNAPVNNAPVNNNIESLEGLTQEQLSPPIPHQTSRQTPPPASPAEIAPEPNTAESMESTEAIAEEIAPTARSAPSPPPSPTILASPPSVIAPATPEISRPNGERDGADDDSADAAPGEFDQESGGLGWERSHTADMAETEAETEVEMMEILDAIATLLAPYQPTEVTGPLVYQLHVAADGTFLSLEPLTDMAPVIDLIDEAIPLSPGRPLQLEIIYTGEQRPIVHKR